MSPTLLDELKLEEEYNMTAMEHYKQAVTNQVIDGETTRTTVGRTMTNHLFKSLFDNNNLFISEIIKPKRGVKPSYYNIAKHLIEIYGEDKRRDLLSLITLATITTAINCTVAALHRPLRASLSYVSKHVALKIMDEANIEYFMNTHDKELRNQMEQGLSNRKSDYYRRYFAVYLMQRNNFKPPRFPMQDLICLGGKLVDILIHSNDFFEYQNVTDEQGLTLTVLAPTQALIDTWNTNMNFMLQYIHSNCPMIIEPDPWLDFDNGGYYGSLRPFNKLLRIHAFRSKDKYTRDYLEKLNQVDISLVLKAVNAIQATPWHVDTKVLDVAQKIVKLGGGRAGIPQMEPTPMPTRLENPTTEELKAQKKKMIQIHKWEISRKGRALRCLGTLKTAERFKNYDNIYFPCNMDFRGRVYPIPSFSFQSDDLNKGLLQMSNVPPVLSEETMDWFLIAGANFAGIDKVSFDDRIKWIKDNESNILDTAEDPIGMLDYWENLDCPFEFLQFCFEYKRWKDYVKENGSSIGFKTGMPIAFDGSCSGIQHYSAMLRDPVGAKAVNLEPSDKPSDIYGLVANEVNKYLDEDAEHGDPDFYDEECHKQKIGTKTMAQLWKTYGVTRKVTKRSVMTLAYGSKEYGFKFQILEDTINPHMNNGVFTPDNAYALASYMAKLIWKGVHKVVTAAVDGMKWLQKVAGIICKDGQVVSWTTPMGLPIQQTYLSTKVEVYRMRISKTERRFYVPESTNEISIRKQKQGIAPNFIHSMDASHLQFSVMTAHKKGIKHFSMIHDSYGTTLADAGKLYKIIRECFVQMYTEHDVLHEFAEEVYIYTNEDLPCPPQKGDFDIDHVLYSKYAFH